MSNREKIIVGLMLLSVIYGVYALFLSSPQPAATENSAKDLEVLNAFITKVATKTNAALPKKQAYILQKAQAKWKQDPLIQIKPKNTEEEEDRQQPVVKSKMLYTGFLQMGDKRLAIINGIEYETGEKLEPGGYIIRSILPNHVVITPPGRKKKTMVLSMEETE